MRFFLAFLALTASLIVLKAAAAEVTARTSCGNSLRDMMSQDEDGNGRCDVTVDDGVNKTEEDLLGRTRRGRQRRPSPAAPSRVLRELQDREQDLPARGRFRQTRGLGFGTRGARAQAPAGPGHALERLPHHQRQRRDHRGHDDLPIGCVALEDDARGSQRVLLQVRAISPAETRGPDRSGTPDVVCARVCRPSRAFGSLRPAPWSPNRWVNSRSSIARSTTP